MINAVTRNWLKGVLVTLKQYNDNPVECMEKMWSKFETAYHFFNTVEGHENNPLFGIDKSLVRELYQRYRIEIFGSDKNDKELKDIHRGIEATVTDCILEHTEYSESELTEEIEYLRKCYYEKNK